MKGLSFCYLLHFRGFRDATESRSLLEARDSLEIIPTRVSLLRDLVLPYRSSGGTCWRIKKAVDADWQGSPK